MELAIGLAFLASIGLGTSTVCARIGLQYVTAMAGIVVAVTVGFIIIGSVALVSNGLDAFEISITALIWTFFLGCLASTGRLLSFIGMYLSGVGRVAPVLATAPLIAIFMGLILGGEELTPFIGLGILFIGSGVALIFSEKMV